MVTPSRFTPAQELQLCNADLDPGRLELAEDDVGNVFGEAFEQQEVLLPERFLDAIDDRTVVDRVVDVVGTRGAAARIADLEIDLDRLRDAALPLVDADQGFHPEVLDEDDVHGAVS